MKKLILLLLAITVSTISNAQSEKEKVQATVSQSQIEGHIYFLADDLLKGRMTGTQENKIAASYLANMLRGYGVKPNPLTGDYYQPVALQQVSPPLNKMVKLNAMSLEKIAVLEASALQYSDNAVYAGYGLKDDYLNINAKGKVLIIKGGSSETQDTRAAFGLRNEKMELALKAGAKGLIELIQVEDQIWDFIDHNFNGPSLSVAGSDDSKMESEFTYVWAQDKEGGLATQLSQNRAIVADINISEAEKETITSQNVIGVVEGTDPKLKNEYIIYSAHYDHVGIGTPDETGDDNYNGARDNAVGTTTVLSMAQHLAKYPTKRSALFILFTGEEKGLLGSEYYVANPVLPLNQMVYCFNSDNAGYNDTTVATIVGLERTTASKHIKEAAIAFGLTAIDDPAPEQGLFDRSDNVHFAKAGIPAPTFSLGFTAFNGDVTKYYHRPGDEADTLDYEYLFKFFSAYVMAGRSIGNDPTTPVWTRGDKYEEAGKMLYGKE